VGIQLKNVKNLLQTNNIDLEITDEAMLCWLKKATTLSQVLRPVKKDHSERNN
jgi:hypothetical protein